MTDEQLSCLLHERTADEAVGPPPLAEMHRAVVRRRRGRLAVLGGAASVALVAGVLAMAEGPAPRQDPPPAAASDAPPDGFRWAGMGSAVVAVPDDWGTNAMQCGTPRRDTVIVDQGAVCAALVPFPADTSAVELRPRHPMDESDDYTPTEVDGERALLGPVECSKGGIHGAGTCRQSLVLPDRDVVFAAETSRGRAALAPILDRVAILDEDVAVPGYAALADDLQGRSGAAYADALEAAGLRARVVTQVRRDITPGYVLDASPAPGTVVAPGATVTLTQVAERAGPADEVVLAFNTEKDDDYRWLEDEQVRGDPTLRVRVGARLWTYAEGKRARSFAVAVAGDAIRPVEGNGRTTAWVAARAGTSTVELSIDVDGERLLLGTVTVVVR